MRDASSFREKRIPCEPGKPPASLTGGSCAYALRVPYEQTPPALASLRRAGIRLQGVYIREDGLWREAVL